MVHLIAIKALTYAGIRRKPGSEFETRTRRDGQILVAIGKARKRADVGEPSKAIVAKFHALDHDRNHKKGGSPKPEGDKDKIARLRSDYLGVVGKKPFAGWGEAELQRRIDEALAK